MTALKNDKGLTVEWIDGGRKATQRPNPNFPNGIDIDLSKGAIKTCVTSVPYPAKQCGSYLITCKSCGMTAGVTTAGRPDDPKTVRLKCRGPRG